MTEYRLTLVTKNQKRKEKASALAEAICEILGGENEFEIYKYVKFDNSYKIVITGYLASGKNAIAQSIELTDRICSPWTVMYVRSEETVNLIFNTSDFARFGRNEFQVLRWADFEISKQ